MTEHQDSSSPLDRAAAAGPLPGTPSDTSDAAPSREDVVSKDEGVIPLADRNLDPRGDTERREQEIADDDTVGGINMSSGLTN